MLQVRSVISITQNRIIIEIRKVIRRLRVEIRNTKKSFSLRDWKVENETWVRLNFRSPPFARNCATRIRVQIYHSITIIRSINWLNHLVIWNSKTIVLLNYLTWVKSAFVRWTSKSVIANSIRACQSHLINLRRRVASSVIKDQNWIENQTSSAERKVGKRMWASSLTSQEWDGVCVG